MSAPIIETEETLIIETPERVPLAFSLASIGNRFLAVAIDHAIQFTAIAVVIFVVLAMSGVNAFGEESIFSELPKWSIAALLIVIFLLLFGYFIAFEWAWNGQTPGKRLMKLRVIREDGRPITIWEAVTRNLLRLFDSAPGFVLPIYSVGLIFVFLNTRDQRVGDLFAGTVVVRERTDDAPTFMETFSNPVADAAYRRVQPRPEMRVDVSTLRSGEVEVIENMLRRRWDLTDRQRQWMAWRVAIPLMYKLKPDYDLATFTYEGFLEEVVHQYQVKQRFLNN
ncbi:MAG: RDD family protein [Blastocatellia bacterium]|nr:RDD family protein [Blastocatellia bacterium]